jgi:hypothetical protein
VLENEAKAHHQRNIFKLSSKALNCVSVSADEDGGGVGVGVK